MEHDISNMILENVQNHKYPFCIIKPLKEERSWNNGWFSIGFNCKFSWITRTNYDGKEASEWEVVIVSNRERKTL
jgi:hypothetical protein